MKRRNAGMWTCIQMDTKNETAKYNKRQSYTKLQPQIFFPESQKNNQILCPFNPVQAKSLLMNLFCCLAHLPFATNQVNKT